MQFRMWLIAQQIINTGTSKFHLEFPKSELKTMVCFFALHEPFPQRESERMRDAGGLWADVDKDGVDLISYELSLDVKSQSVDFKPIYSEYTK